MLDFPIHVYEEPRENKVYAPSFRSPVLFFLTDRTDPRSVFAAFALGDFRRGRITYITSNCPENARQLERLMTPSLERHFPILRGGEFRQVHSAIEIVPDESFYAFPFASSACGFFYHVDYKKKRMRLITAEDFQALSRSGPIESFGSTFSKDPDDPQHFYLTAKMTPCDAQPSHRIAYYRVSLDLRHITPLFSRTCEPDQPCPHATRKWGNYLLSSDFNETEYQLKKSGKVFRSDASFHDHVVHDYWSGLGTWARAGAIGSRVLVHPFALARTLRKQKRASPGSRLSDVAIDCCFRGTHPSRDFIWACLNSEEYQFRLAPGSIRVLSLTEGTEAAYAVRHSKPAHFEFGQAGHVYLSCHTFFAWNRRSYFIEPAAILKLRLTGGAVEEQGVFRHPTGFRFTSHVVFQADHREYLCTVGQPNRLFVIDGETMELVAFRDIGTDYLSSQTDIASYLSRSKLEGEAIRALAVSEDGKYLVLAGGDGLSVVELGSLDIIDFLPVAASVSRLAGRAAGEVLCDALHCQRLR